MSKSWWASAVLATLGLLLLAACSTPAGVGKAESPGPYQGTDLGGTPAPDFQLHDQHGRAVALSDLRGKAVVLTFLDSKCTDVCPLTAQQLRLVDKGLGAQRSQVAYLGVNTNRYANRVEDVAEFTGLQRLEDLSAWHFLTGEPQALEGVWESYHIAVQGDHADEVAHTAAVYLIDQQGREQRYIGALGSEPESSLIEILLPQLRHLLGSGS